MNVNCIGQMKSLWNANVQRKPIEASKYVTFDSKLSAETNSYINGFKSTIANYAKANKVKIDIAGVTKKKLGVDVFYVKASKNTPLGYVATVVCKKGEELNDKIIHKLFSAVARATKNVAGAK